MDKKPDKITYHYNMNNNYKVIHVDGAFGGITPTGYINMNLFSEIRPLPETSVYAITEGTVIAKEIVSERKGKDGVIREVEVGLLLDIERARSLVDWLQGKIEEFDNIISSNKKVDSDEPSNDN